MSFLRNVIFSNWRNKGVALFFAVIIWGVAFQSESQEDLIPIHVVMMPQQAETVVLKQLAPVPDNTLQAFNGTIHATVRGTRKQVEEFKKNVGASFPIRVDGSVEPDAEPTTYTFEKDSFRFKSFSFIEMQKFDPPFVQLRFDRVDTKELPVQLSFDLPSPGLEIVKEVVTPAQVMVSGPESLFDKIQVIAEPDFSESDDPLRFSGKVRMKIVPSRVDGVVVEDLVEIQGQSSKVDLQIVLGAKTEEFEREQVPIRFATPPDFRYTVFFEDSRIPVLFRGPEQEIKGLKTEVEKSDFFLSVKIDVDGLTGTDTDQRTFTEGDLLLHGGYSRDVQVLKHSKRQREGGGLWSYSLVPNRSSEESEQ